MGAGDLHLLRAQLFVFEAVILRMSMALTLTERKYALVIAIFFLALSC